jgi:hypothetical protein
LIRVDRNSVIKPGVLIASGRPMHSTDLPLPTPRSSGSTTDNPLFLDPIHRVPRLWSNTELARVGALFTGAVVNVSAWRDEDKEGRRYRDYFPRASRYAVTNYRADMRGYQGWDDEIFLNLEEELPPDLFGAFDVVFNHTTLEHIYEFRRAFANLCGLSRDVVIAVVPWLQPYHSEYGDYWRFSPLAMARLYEENGLTPARIVWNRDRGASIYVFAVGVRQPEQWKDAFEFDCDPERLKQLDRPAGDDVFQQPLGIRLRSAARAAGLGRIKRALRRPEP